MSVLGKCLIGGVRLVANGLLRDAWAELVLSKLEMLGIQNAWDVVVVVVVGGGGGENVFEMDVRAE